MSEVYNWSVRELIEKSASAAPTPGGGSIAALAGSLAVAMVAMVGNLTVGKEKYQAVEPIVMTELEQLNKLLDRLEGLVNEDIQAFSNFMEVLKLPKATEADQQLRNERLQQTLKSATETPLEIARTCLQTLVIAEKISSIGNKGAISDVGVGAYLAEAALQAALLSVDINLPGIKDPSYVETVLAEKAQLVTDSKAFREKTIAQVQQRI